MHIRLAVSKWNIDICLIKQYSFLFGRMNSIHDCVLIEEDWLLWQTLVLMIMAVNFSLLWVVQMNLTTSTPSLARYVRARSYDWNWFCQTQWHVLLNSMTIFLFYCCVHLKIILLLSKLFHYLLSPPIAYMPLTLMFSVHSSCHHFLFSKMIFMFCRAFVHMLLKAPGAAAHAVL